jgi:hypothetical protein
MLNWKKLIMYAPRHENCPLFAFDTTEKSDTFCDGEHSAVVYIILKLNRMNRINIGITK